MDVDLISCLCLIFCGSVFACVAHTYLKMLDVLMVCTFEMNRKCLVSISMWYLHVPNIPGTLEHDINDSPSHNVSLPNFFGGEVVAVHRLLHSSSSSLTILSVVAFSFPAVTLTCSFEPSTFA